MECLSSAVAPQQPAVVKQTESNDISYASQLSPENAKLKQDALKKSVSERVQLNYELEQDTMEGVDSNEWEE